MQNFSDIPHIDIPVFKKIVIILHTCEELGNPTSVAQMKLYLPQFEYNSNFKEPPSLAGYSFPLLHERAQIKSPVTSFIRINVLKLHEEEKELNIM